MTLITTANLDQHDAFFAELLEAHRGLGESESTALNAQLVLILANHVGDIEVLRAALALARAK